MEYLSDLKTAGHPADNIAIVYENTDYGTSVSGTVREIAKKRGLNIVADIAYNGVIWRSHSPGWGSLDGVDFATSGIPTEADYVASYCRRTGRAGIDDWAFYMAFGIFRLASIGQGVYRRVLAGTAATAGREAINGTPALAEQALGILRG